MKFLDESGFDIVNDGQRLLWVPDEAAYASCVEYGKKFSEAL